MLAVRIPADLLSAIDAEADSLGVSRSEVVRSRLDAPTSARAEVALAAARQLRTVLDLLDEGELTAHPTARPYLAGAAAALADELSLPPLVTAEELELPPVPSWEQLA
jgi:hypothetical protein